MGGLTLIYFARASYAELDPGTTQCAYEPHLYYTKQVQTGLLFLELGSLRMLLRAPSPLCPKHETAPPLGLDASQAHPFGKGHESTSPVVHRRFVFPAAIAGVRCW